MLAQFGAGQSNPTYLLLVVSSTGKVKLVLGASSGGSAVGSRHRARAPRHERTPEHRRACSASAGPVLGQSCSACRSSIWTTWRGAC